MLCCVFALLSVNCILSDLVVSMLLYHPDTMHKEGRSAIYEVLVIAQLCICHCSSPTVFLLCRGSSIDRTSY